MWENGRKFVILNKCLNTFFTVSCALDLQDHNTVIRKLFGLGVCYRPIQYLSSMISFMHSNLKHEPEFKKPNMKHVSIDNYFK